MTLREALALLTRRERQILRLRCQGFTILEVAEKLFISEQTVKNHSTNTYRKVEEAVPNMRGRTRAGSSNVICYALGGLICHDNHD